MLQINSINDFITEVKEKNKYHEIKITFLDIIYSAKGLILIYSKEGFEKKYSGTSIGLLGAVRVIMSDLDYSNISEEIYCHGDK